MIPKILFQISRDRLEPHVFEELARFGGPGWEYRHFTDEDIFAYFARHALPGFPDMVEKFRAMPTGANAADLFRYFHLWVEGGVYVDSDAMLKAPLDALVAGADFFTVRSGYLPGSVFQGFIGCAAGHPLMRLALEDTYNVDLDRLKQSYHLLCVHLHDILERHGQGHRVRLFEEVMLSNGVCEILDENNRIVLLHYFASKVVPRRLADSRPRPPTPQDVIGRLFALARAGRLAPELRALAAEKLRASGAHELLSALEALDTQAA